MTFTVSVAATTTTATVPAANPAAGLFQARILTPDALAEVQKLTGDKPQFTFKGVAAGAYKCEMARLDVNGTVIALSVVSMSFDTGSDNPSNPVPDTVTIDIPTSLTIACTQE